MLGLRVSGDGTGIQCDADSVTIEGCEFIGSSFQGIAITGKRCRVGGPLPGARTVISSNNTFGIQIGGGASGTSVQGCLIGTDNFGTSASGGLQLLGIYVYQNLAPSSDTILIGGYQNGARNVISNNSTGILVDIDNATVTKIVRNYVGLDASGTFALPNATGINVSGPARVIIGSNAFDDRNVISGNGGSGIDVLSSDHIISGNLIGLAADGITPVPNAGSGVSVSGANNRIADCAISGNTGHGIELVGRENTIVGCYIGTDTSGMIGTGNGGRGIVINGPSNTIGEKDSDRRNVISGNLNEQGVLIENGADSTTLLGNIIGMNRTMSAPLLNGFEAILIATTDYHIIGDGTEAGANYLDAQSGNAEIFLSGSAGNVAQGTQILGNYIGTNKLRDSVTFQLNDYGIFVGDFVQNVTIGIDNGTPDPAPANVIMNHNIAGIALGTPAAAQRNIRIEANSYRNNGGLAIDLGNDGVTPNDPLDADSGPNDNQNFPVIDSALTTETSTTIYGMLNSLPGTSFQIQFYSSDTCSPSGYGNGEEYLGLLDVITNGSGDAPFAFSPASPVNAGRFITATATDLSGNSSELSLCRIVTVPVFTVAPTADTADIFFLERADLDRDNFVDYVFTGLTDDSLFVAWGRADGTLDLPVGLAAITRAAIRIDYADTDTLLDITARSATQLFVLTNQGNRTFSISSAPLLRSIEGRSQSVQFPAITSGYFNADQFVDLVASENKLLLGDGTGSFGLSQTLPFSFDDVDVADMNNDFKDDLVFTRADSAIVYLNDGTGNFTPAGSLAITPLVGDYTRVQASVDLNQDGRNDIVTIAGNTTGANDTSFVTSALGDGLGNLTAADTTTIVGRGLNFTVTDVEKDGDLDVVVVTSDSRLLQVYSNNGSGVFTMEAATDLGAGSDPLYGLADGDLDRDGNIDLVTGGASGQSIVLAVNQSPNEPILVDEMVTTAYDNLFVIVTNPSGLTISDRLRTVAGSAYARVDRDSNGVLDDRAFDYNLQEGTYGIAVGRRDNTIVPITAVGIGIDGSAEAFVARNYNGLGAGDTLRVSFSIGGATTSPASGSPTFAIQPVVSWQQGYAPRGIAAITYRFQLSSYHDFRTLLVDSSSLEQPQILLPAQLASDSVFYWRVAFGDNPFSLPAALYIAPGACGRAATGNVDCDGPDQVDIADLTLLVDHLFISNQPLCCPSEGNVDASPNGQIDIVDLTLLVDHLFISNPPLPPCL